MSSATITFLGHSAVLIVTEAEKRMLIDPWLIGNPSCPEEFQDPGRIDFIGLTHGHSDHAGNATIFAKQTGAIVFATYELCSLLAAEGVVEDNLQRMNKGGTVRAGGIAVTLTHAFHSSSYDASDGTSRYAGEACGMVVHLESGKTIFHAGDTALFGDLALIGKRYRPALAMLPIGDRFTMGPEEAATATALLQCPKVIPIHHSTFPALSGTPDAFREALRREAPETECIVLKPGASYRI